MFLIRHEEKPIDPLNSCLTDCGKELKSSLYHPQDKISFRKSLPLAILYFLIESPLSLKNLKLNHVWLPAPPEKIMMRLNVAKLSRKSTKEEEEINCHRRRITPLMSPRITKV